MGRWHADARLVQNVFDWVPIPLPNRLPWPSKFEPLLHDVLDLIVTAFDVVIEAKD